jgi:branched-chain amino acid transport system ATP-binding protein
MAPLLDVIDLRSGYALMEVLHGISLYVMPGELVALVGANGAGKSTLLNTIVGVVPVRSGRVSFDSTVISSLSTRDIVRKGRPSPYQLKTEMESVFELFPKLRDRRHQLTQSMSGGEQQMTAIARALMARPRLLLLDEPSLGLAPLVVDQIIEQLAGLRASGCTILLVEQNARLALSIADRAYVVETGKIAMSGSAAELLSNESIQDAYLGGRDHVANSMEERIRARRMAEAISGSAN